MFLCSIKADPARSPWIPFSPTRLFALALLGALVLPACEVEDPAPAESVEPELGMVEFPTSCSAEAQPHLDRGLLMLHHMMYPQAEGSFEEAAAVEEECAMARWGLAMAHFQPFWGSAEVEAGRAHAEQALALDPPTEREELYARAALAFFEAPDAGYAARLRSWEAAMQELHEAYPDDPEAATLFALAHLSVGPDDPNRLARAGSIVEAVHTRVPDHPGAVHYAIHVHDVDALADEGVRFAEAYEELAPTIPHALHMPSHIYVRTGEWDEVIDWNRRSADAALEHPAGEHISLHYPHALDYLMYGHLQRGEDEAASDILQELRSQEGYQPHLASGYALAAIPARWHVERRDWAGAAGLEPGEPAGFAWELYPAAEAMTWFARGLGSARTGDTEGARVAQDRLAVLEDGLHQAGDTYWARRVEIQRLSVAAWEALAVGDPDSAESGMRTAAELEGSMEKHAITPGELQPAYELLGDLLLELGRPAEALEAYEESLEMWPRRYHTLLGAARAADGVAEEDVALGYYEELLELAAGADPDREGLAEARARVAAR
jgi:tetratricopeptide (TPR) repeat protein